jgi:hypothetical protein
MDWLGKFKEARRTRAVEITEQKQTKTPKTPKTKKQQKPSEPQDLHVFLINPPFPVTQQQQPWVGSEDT